MTRLRARARLLRTAIRRRNWTGARLILRSTFAGVAGYVVRAIFGEGRG